MSPLSLQSRKLRAMDNEQFRAKPRFESATEQLADVMVMYVDEVGAAGERGWGGVYSVACCCASCGSCHGLHWGYSAFPGFDRQGPRSAVTSTARSVAHRGMQTAPSS